MRRDQRQVSLVAAFLSLCLASALSGDVLPQLTLTVSTDRVLVEGLPPGESAVVIGYGREHFGGVSTRRFYRWEKVQDADHDGRVELAAGDRKFPSLAVWLAFLPVGGQLLAASATVPVEVTERSASELAFGSGVVEMDSAQKLQILLRRGGGAWVWDGRGEPSTVLTDSGSVEYRLGAVPSSFQPIEAAAEAAEFFAPGDLLVSIHQLDLTVEARYAQ